MQDFDVIIIGGGVVGTGVARDCAMRGLRTILLEKKDFCAGTSGTCSGMVHGGPRYLKYDVDTTYLSCLDSGYIQKIAPHLIFRIPFIIPVFKDHPYGIEKVETFFTIYDKFQPLKGGLKHGRLTREEALKLEPMISPDITGAVTMDEWGIDVFRLCILNALSAENHKAVIRNYIEVTDFIKEGNKIKGVKITDKISGKKDRITASIVLNAAGPWVPEICKMADTEVKMRPAKGVHLILDRRISNIGIILTAIDGRDIFVLPHENTTLIGCTDDDYFGDLDNVKTIHDEVEYLLTSAEYVIPSIREARIIRCMAGVRNTLYTYGILEDNLSREFEIFDHEQRDNVPGFITIAGGKMAMYRYMSEKVTDLICEKLGNTEKCKTHVEYLSGSQDIPDAIQLAEEYNMPVYTIKRLIFRHGAKALDILAPVKELPFLKSHICTCEPVTEAEIRYCIRNEMVVTLDDLRRRTRLGTGPCQGMNCTWKAAAIMGEELNWPLYKIHKEIMAFLKERWKGKMPILTGEQLRQEELNQAIYAS